MADIAAALAKLLTDNPGPVSIAAGIKALRAVGAGETDGDLQSIIASFAAERWRGYPLRPPWVRSDSAQIRPASAQF